MPGRPGVVIPVFELRLRDPADLLALGDLGNLLVTLRVRDADGSDQIEFPHIEKAFSVSVVKGAMPEFTVSNFVFPSTARTVQGIDSIRTREALQRIFEGNEDSGALVDRITHIRVRLEHGVTDDMDLTADQPKLFAGEWLGAPLPGYLSDSTQVKIVTPSYVDMTLDKFLSPNRHVSFSSLGGTDAFLKFHISTDGGITWSRQIITAEDFQTLHAAQYYDLETDNNAHLFDLQTHHHEWEGYVRQKGWLAPKPFYGEAMTQSGDLSMDTDQRVGYKIWWGYGDAGKVWSNLPKIDLSDDLLAEAPRSNDLPTVFYGQMNLVGDARLDTILYAQQPGPYLRQLGEAKIYGILEGYSGPLGAGDIKDRVNVYPAQILNSSGNAREYLYTDVNDRPDTFNVNVVASVVSCPWR